MRQRHLVSLSFISQEGRATDATWCVKKMTNKRLSWTESFPTRSVEKLSHILSFSLVYLHVSTTFSRLFLNVPTNPQWSAHIPNNILCRFWRKGVTGLSANREYGSMLWRVRCWEGKGNWESFDEFGSGRRCSLIFWAFLNKRFRQSEGCKSPSPNVKTAADDKHANRAQRFFFLAKTGTNIVTQYLLPHMLLQLEAMWVIHLLTADYKTHVKFSTMQSTPCVVTQKGGATKTHRVCWLFCFICIWS